LVPYGGGGAVEVFRPIVVCVADVWLGKVSSVRWGVHVVLEEKLDLTLQGAELGGNLVEAFGAGEQRCEAE
jgi:hypothetical protein